MTQDIRYALVFLEELRLREGRQASVREVALKYQLSEKFLEQVAGKLKRARLLWSQRGRVGGYRMMDSDQLTAFEIFKALGQESHSISCSLADGCTGGAVCREREIEAEMIGKMNDVMAGITVANYQP